MKYQTLADSIKSFEERKDSKDKDTFDYRCLSIRICYQLSIRMLIDKPFSRVLVTIQLLIRQPSYQPTIDNEACLINS
jgi:hypothetical protein